METKSYNFMTIRLWAKEKSGVPGRLMVSIEPEIIPGFGEPGSALERYGKACTSAMAIAIAAISRSEEDKILNRAEIRALMKRLDELESGGNLSGKSPIRVKIEGI